MKLAIGLLVVMVVAGVMTALFFQEEDSVKQDYIVAIASPGHGMNNAVDGFIEGMKSYGFEEGRNVTYIIHSGKNGIDDALNEMMKKKADLFFTMTTPITKKAKALTIDRQLPVVFIMHDPVASGVVGSLISPGGNLTGVQLQGSTPKALEWLQIIMPDVKRVFVPVGQESVAANQSLQDLERAGQQLGISIFSKALETKEELDAALAKVPADIDAIFALHSVLVMSNIEAVEKIAATKKIPIVSLHQNKAATITFGANGYRTGVQVSRLASQALHGVEPADMPIELAEYYLGINLKKARHIGLPISNRVLLQADNVIR